MILLKYMILPYIESIKFKMAHKCIIFVAKKLFLMIKDFTGHSCQREVVFIATVNDEK